MASISVKRFDTPDETRPFASKGRAEVLKFESGAVGRGVFEPGWKWSECVKPIAKTESCEVEHAVFVMSGRMQIRMDDGEEVEIGQGDVAMIPPGHDAWVVGDQACVAVDFGDFDRYALPASEGRRGTSAEPQQPGMH